MLLPVHFLNVTLITFVSDLFQSGIQISIALTSFVLFVTRINSLLATCL